MRSKLLAAVIALPVCALLCLSLLSAAGPHRALGHIYLAAKSEDVAALEKWVDYESVRRGYEEDLQSEMRAVVGAARGSVGERMAGVLERHMVRTAEYHARKITEAKALHELLASEAGSGLTHYDGGWDSPVLFRATVSRPVGDVRLELQRNGWDWRVTRISRPVRVSGES